MASRKCRPERVHPRMARQALETANGDRRRAWTEYILLSFRTTGRLAPGCDNRDLQEFYRLMQSEDQDDG